MSLIWRESESEEEEGGEEEEDEKEDEESVWEEVGEEGGKMEVVCHSTTIIVNHTGPYDDDNKLIVP